MTTFEIRNKMYNFQRAPVLDGETAWWAPVIAYCDDDGIDDVEEVGGMFRHAIEAAIAAARFDHENRRGRGAHVVCRHPGIERPHGTPRGFVPVSYRPRKKKPIAAQDQPVPS